MNYILKNLAIGNFEDAQDPPDGIDALLCVALEIDLFLQVSDVRNDEQMRWNLKPDT
jgi:hypothetical protein